VSDLPIALGTELDVRLAAALDIEGKIPRAFAALGPIDGRDVLLLDADGPIREGELAELGARVTALQTSGPAVRPPGHAFDAVVSCWSRFRDASPADLVEAERVLRPGGRLLVLHDYGRDDVSTLRGMDLPEYAKWSRPNGWFLRNGFKVRVIHCWWTFESIEAATDFLGSAFGAPGTTLGQGLRRPRLSYNIAIYHRTFGPPAA
jgi:SAM-dependent methyltransferase